MRALGLKDTKRVISVSGEKPTVSTTSVSPSQRPIEVPWNFEIRIVGQRSAVGVDVPHLLVRLDHDGDLAGRQQELHRIGLAHDAGHAGRQAVRRR